MDTPLRSLTKAISWRIVATLTTVLLVFMFTRNLIVSSGVGATELVVKILVYFLHERLWNKLGFGQK